jgi:hypothetical protein
VTMSFARLASQLLAHRRIGAAHSPLDARVGAPARQRRFPCGNPWFPRPPAATRGSAPGVIQRGESAPSRGRIRTRPRGSVARGKCCRMPQATAAPATPHRLDRSPLVPQRLLGAAGLEDNERAPPPRTRGTRPRSHIAAGPGGACRAAEPRGTSEILRSRATRRCTARRRPLRGGLKADRSSP